MHASVFIAYSYSYSWYGHVFGTLEIVVEAIEVTKLSWSSQESPVYACTYSVGPIVKLILGIKFWFNLIVIDCWRGLRYLDLPPISPWSGAYCLYMSCIYIPIIYKFIVRVAPVLPALNYPRAPCTYFYSSATCTIPVLLLRMYYSAACTYLFIRKQSTLLT